MEAFNDYSERFLSVIESLGLTDYKVWNKLENLSKGTMSKIRTGRCGVSMNTLQEFVQAYPTVNADYIITGRGSMFVTPEMSESDTEKTKDALQTLIDEVQRLRVENEELKQELAKKARSA